MKNEILEIREQLNIPEGTMIESIQQQINYYKAVRELVALLLDKEAGKAIKKHGMDRVESTGALLMVGHQFKEAKKILEKYQIKI